MDCSRQPKAKKLQGKGTGIQVVVSAGGAKHLSSAAGGPGRGRCPSLAACAGPRLGSVLPRAMPNKSPPLSLHCPNFRSWNGSWVFKFLCDLSNWPCLPLVFCLGFRRTDLRIESADRLAQVGVVSLNAEVLAACVTERETDIDSRSGGERATAAAGA